ncbi:hypothetical protein M0805_006491 [Coniferiporia weirii]|nr:hypothetical protein M0805_006491 [Coniferiporia weirii]
MSSVPVVRVYLVRHGETNENRAGIIQGQMDTVLNADGSLQARLCGEALKNVKFSLALSSDLKRTLKTAELILLHHPGVELFQRAALRERDMGELQGVRVGQYDKTKLPKSVETGEAFARRTLKWWEDDIGKYLPTIASGPEPANILVVSHGAFIATLCKSLVAHKIVQIPPGTGFGVCYNTSVTTLDMGRDKRGTLVRYSDISHLLQPAVETNADEQPQG